jgi:hypothetical protein
VAFFRTTPPDLRFCRERSNAKRYTDGRNADRLHCLLPINSSATKDSPASRHRYANGTDTPTQVDKIPNQIAATPRKPEIVSPNLEDIFAECHLSTLVSPITTPCSDTVSELLDGYGPPPPVRTTVVARPMFIPTPDQLPFTTSRHQYIMHNAAMDVEFEWEQPLSQMEEGLFPVVEMSMLEVIEVKLRQSDEAAMLTDASSYALGAALFQGESPDERPIEYASRLLKPPEKNYSTTEREALAVVWSVQKFRGYLEEAPAVIITDHQPLRWLMSLKSPSG